MGHPVDNWLSGKQFNEPAVVDDGSDEAAAVGGPEGGVRGAGAVGRREHAVVQHPVPVLTSHNSEIMQCFSVVLT